MPTLDKNDHFLARAPELGLSASARLRFPPHFLQPLSAAAVEFIELVANRILFIEILVILFRRIEDRRRNDLCGYRGAKLLRIFDAPLRRFSRFLLVRSRRENRRAVLIAMVTKLRIGGEWIHIAPEHIQKLLITHLSRIINYLNRLRMSRSTCRDLFIGRIGQGAIHVTGNGREHTVDLFKGLLHAPETAAGKIGFG